MDIEQLADEHFGVTVDKLIDAMLASANARGYILGAVAELELRDHLEGLGLEVKRIKEKWVGEKLHHGDFYVSRNSREWFVFESKGLKSNAEKWQGLWDVPEGREQVYDWIARKRSPHWKELLAAMTSDEAHALKRVTRPGEVSILETHFVSGTAGKSGRKIATPRVDEFHVVTLDTYIKLGEHRFLFAAADDLERSKGHPEHLKQNYLVGLTIPDERLVVGPLNPWTSDAISLISQLRNPVDERDMQVDDRAPGARAEGVDYDWS